MAISDSAILKKIEQQPKRSAGFKQLARELGVRGEGRQELSERLGKLVASGQLIQITSERYGIPKSMGRNTFVGRLSLHRDGFGFVIPDPTSLDEKLRAKIVGDVFIPPPAIGNAMHGDQVLAEIAVVRPDGRVEGRIIRPLNRAHPTIVGIFHYGTRYNSVTPIDRKVAQEVVIPAGMEYPQEKPTDGDTEHRVVGKEAARRTDWSDLEGVVVDVEITQFPTINQNPRGRVVEILGYESDFGVDVEIMIRKFHLPHRFPAEVLEQARNE